MAKTPAPHGSPTDLTAALTLLLEKGFAATSVDELAAVAGMSRSTFFRRFSSKEDIVFADHEIILSRVANSLEVSRRQSPLRAVTDAVMLVFTHHVENREQSLLRRELLQREGPLRDRELITSHRYEQLFRDHLQSTADEQEYLATSFAASVVAIHNRVLRRWLAEAAESPTASHDDESARRLDSELTRIATIFQDALAPSAGTQTAHPAVVVTILDPAASRDDILESIGRSLPDRI